MIMGTAMPAFAVDDNPPAAAADTLTVSKVLEKDASDYVPNEKWERCTPDAERLCQLYRWGVDNARYGIELFASSAPAHDGTAPDGKLVQIKATQRDSVGISAKPDFLIVLRIDKRGGIDEVYNGPGEPVWSLFANRKRPKNGQHQVSLARLKKLNEEVPLEKRIPNLF